MTLTLHWAADVRRKERVASVDRRERINLSWKLVAEINETMKEWTNLSTKQIALINKTNEIKTNEKWKDERRTNLSSEKIAEISEANW